MHLGGMNMSTIWETFAEFWQAWGPFIGTALIPTIIVGLSVSPKTAEAKGVIEKVWNILKQVLDFLSVATHKDKDGTFQLPFKLDSVRKKEEDSDGPPSPPTGPILPVVMLAIFLTLPQAGCAWLKTTGHEAKDTAIDCTVSSVQDNARALVPAVIGILTGGAVNWKDQVKTFVKGFGRDATACAMQVALQRLNDPIASEPNDDPEAVRVDSVKRASQFLDEQNWNFVR